MHWRTQGALYTPILVTLRPALHSLPSTASRLLVDNGSMELTIYHRKHYFQIPGGKRVTFSFDFTDFQREIILVLKIRTLL